MVLFNDDMCWKLTIASNKVRFGWRKKCVYKGVWRQRQVATTEVPLKSQAIRKMAMDKYYCFSDGVTTEMHKALPRIDDNKLGCVANDGAAAPFYAQCNFNTTVNLHKLCMKCSLPKWQIFYIFHCVPFIIRCGALTVAVGFAFDVVFICKFKDDHSQELNKQTYLMGCHI